ncbi:uncharacterized protein LOC121879224 [Homarus americanus]|uniref:uncharacterized protein LOC121879224 n=1 Tax=Homarus americanus TaxID=6706 RepID=UPI001C44F4C1|nr:uncharacterized protein LOC121879224 [Homarus americanus]
MRTTGLLLLALVFASVHADDDDMVVSYRTGDLINLKVLEIREVMQESSTDDRNHSIKVSLADHDPIPNLRSWTLIIIGNERKVYTQEAGDSQTELEFYGDINVLKNVFVLGNDKSNNTVAVYYGIMNITMTSRLAWVGDAYHTGGASLRVDTGDLEEVEAGIKVCRKEHSPCYFIGVPLPEDIPRCYASTDESNPIKVCDETITKFKEIREPVHLERSGNNLTVHVTFSTTPTKVEVLVFDVNNPTNVLSPENYQCQAMNEPRQVHCMQQLVAADHIQTLMVLVVGLDDNGYVLESSFAIYGDTPSEDKTGLIVGSVFGVLCGVAIIAFIVCTVMKKKKKKGGSSATRVAGEYERTATQEPPSREEA